MSGYIDNNTGQGLWESYASGRASAGAHLEGGSSLAQWSAVNDSKTCDFCGWADERIFDTRFQPWYPPEHYGCRCIIAYILSDEFQPEPDWGEGPPSEAFPPGQIGLLDDVARNVGQTEIPGSKAAAGAVKKPPVDPDD